SRESGLMIPSGGRLRKPINDPADLLRRLHQGSLAQPTTARNRAEDSRRPERQRRELRERPSRLTRVKRTGTTLATDTGLAMQWPSPTSEATWAGPLPSVRVKNVTRTVENTVGAPPGYVIRGVRIVATVVTSRAESSTCPSGTDAAVAEGHAPDFYGTFNWSHTQEMTWVRAPAGSRAALLRAP